VAAVSGTNAWAVGQYCVSACGKPAEADHTLILHWNGSTWAQAPSPSPGAFPELHAVTALSGTDAWAVGEWCSPPCNTSSNVFHTLTLRWNGSAWVQVPSPTPGGNIFGLFGVSATSSTNAWAAGTTGHARSMILHWNGTKWSTVSSPNQPGFATFLYGAAAASASNAWAVGNQGLIDANLSTVTMRWNGTAWSIVKSPNP
jgi:hypothetical protein